MTRQKKEVGKRRGGTSQTTSLRTLAERAFNKTDTEAVIASVRETPTSLAAVRERTFKRTDVEDVLKKHGAPPTEAVPDISTSAFTKLFEEQRKAWRPPSKGKN